MGRHHFRQRNQQCKGPEVGAFLTCSRTSKRWCNWSGVSEGESTRERGREVTGLGLEGHQHLFNKMGGHCKVKSRGMTRFNLNCKMITLDTVWRIDGRKGRVEAGRPIRGYVGI